MSQLGPISTSKPDEPRGVIRGEAGDLIRLDASFFPVVVTTWYGATTERAIREYYRWVRQMGARAKAERTQMVNITDAGLGGVPTAPVRRLISDLTKELDQDGFRAFMHSITVIDNVLVRGALTAIAWVHGDLNTPTVATRIEALERAAAILKPFGVEVPGLVRGLSERPKKP